MTAAERNRRVFDTESDLYVDRALMPDERQILRLLGPRLAGMDMLDLGVGTGRTGYTYACLVRRYVGVDYSPQMIRRARRLLGDDDRVVLLEGDARDLLTLSETFDFVLFSFNGIDAVGHADRLKILEEIRCVLRPRGYFQFSTHSLGALPLSEKAERDDGAGAGRNPFDKIYRRLSDARFAQRIRRLNAKIDLDAARSQGWVVVPERGHNFQVDDYYIDPAHQVSQLHDAGFAVDTILDRAGNEVSLPYGGTDAWLTYLCRPRD